MSPKLFGLVLAGGASRRMGRDKGALIYHGEPQAVHAWRLLTEVCGTAYLSISASQAAAAPYADLPLIPDVADDCGNPGPVRSADDVQQGPAAGLASAWTRHPHAAWLVLAVDMPRVDRPLLAELVAARDPGAFATAFRHPDGTLEPLCTIWEPAARAPLLERIAAERRSLRRLLERIPTAAATPSTPEKLRGANDIEEHEDAKAALETRRR